MKRFDVSKAEFEISNFTRIIWRTPRDKELWEPRLNRISRLHALTEYEMVRRGYRRAATYHVTLENFPQFIERIQRDGLIFLPIARSAFYSGFSHKHIPPRRGEPYFWYGVIARTEEDARRFKEASGRRDGHLVIGELLGYPSCCTQFFTEVWNAGVYDPLWEVARNDGSPVVEENPWLKTADKLVIYITDPYPEAIQELRYFGIRVTSHIPHSHRCEETRRVGKKWRKVMEDLDPEAVDWLYEILESPIVWDSYHGVVQVHTPWFIGVTQTYPYLDLRRIVVLNDDRIPWDIYV